MTPNGTATTTIVCSDLTGHVPRRSRGPGDARYRVDGGDLGRSRLAPVVRAHDGSVVMAAGRGVVGAFGAASVGLAAAMAMQREVQAQSGDLRARVGVAAGDIVWEHGDCFGAALLVAARLQRAAVGGQILVTRVVRSLAGQGVMDAARALGTLQVPGLDEVVDVYEVGRAGGDDAVDRAALLPSGLSWREVEVLRLVACGCSNREIGDRLFISPNTAANHVRSILVKTACGNRAEAVAYAARHRLLDFGDR